MATSNSIISTASNPRAWDRSFNKIFYDNYALVPNIMEMLVNQDTPMNGMTHYDKRGLDIPIGNAREMREGQPVQFDSWLDGPQKTVTPTKFGLGIQATIEAHKDDRFGHIREAQKQLAKSMNITSQMKQADLFNSAFSTSRLGIDGKALCATDHPLYGASGSVVSNIVTGALSKSTLLDAILKGNKLVDERGRPIQYTFKTLVIPPELEPIAKELLLSEYDPGTGNNAVNTLTNVNGGKGTNFTQKLSYIVNRYATSSTAWFLISDKSEHDLRHIVFDGVTPATFTDNNTDNIVYKVTSRWVDTFWLWRGVIGSTGL